MKISRIRQIIKEEYQNLLEANTPWGKSDVEYKIDNGVIWYGTPSHGGLKVAGNMAQKKLSPQARALGEQWGSSYWYEEDVAYAIPMYENPKWMKTLAKEAGGKDTSNSELKSIIKKWFPKYFNKDFSKIVKSNLQIPEIKSGYYITLDGGGTYQVENKKGDSWMVKGDNYKLYKLTKHRLKRDVIKIANSIGKVIWEKK